jgi:hypothetical protein
MKRNLITILMLNSFMLLGMQQKSPMETIPKDLKVLIIKELTLAPTMQEAAANIRNLGAVNTHYQKIINDSKLTEYLINELARKYEVPAPYDFWLQYINRDDMARAFAAFALHTNSSLKWLYDFIRNYQSTLLGELGLLYTIQTNKPEGVAFFLQAGANPNIPHIQALFLQPSPLLQTIIFVAKENKEIMDLLIKAGADLEESLTFALINKRADLIKRFMDAGADPNLVPAGWNESLLDFAKRMHYSYIVEIMEDALKKRK